MFWICFSDVIKGRHFKWQQTDMESATESEPKVSNKILAQLDRDSSGIPHYSNLEWRLETQIASRMLRDQLEPRLILRFELDQTGNKVGGEKKFVTLQCDPSNLINLHQSMEDALAQARSQHLLKIARHVK